MPYELVKVDGGWKVKKKGTNKFFSDKPLPRKRAVAQMRALYMNERTSK